MREWNSARVIYYAMRRADRIAARIKEHREDCDGCSWLAYPGASFHPEPSWAKYRAPDDSPFRYYREKLSAGLISATS